MSDTDLVEIGLIIVGIPILYLFLPINILVISTLYPPVGTATTVHFGPPALNAVKSVEVQVKVAGGAMLDAALNITLSFTIKNKLFYFELTRA